MYLLTEKIKKWSRMMQGRTARFGRLWVAKKGMRVRLQRDGF